jgi:hypothetical protein
LLVLVDEGPMSLFMVMAAPQNFDGYCETAQPAWSNTEVLVCLKLTFFRAVSRRLLLALSQSVNILSQNVKLVETVRAMM